MTNTHKIQPFHRSRQAYIYVRQSSQAQVRNHTESQRCQLQLVDLAQSYGWPAPVILDEDLGISASGCHHRADFEALTTAVCQEQIGIILSFDVSRLARNSREWSRLLEFCTVTHTLLADFQGIYDLKLNADDRLVLGLKGTLSEVELESIKTRLLQARLSLARRGELINNVGIGYVRSGKRHLCKDPNARIQHAISLIFTKFFELRTVHKVYRWSRSSSLSFPHLNKAQGDTSVDWKLPSYDYFRRILGNPCYAGTYAYGKTESKVVLANGRKRIREGLRKEMADWEVLIHDHHEAYISWEQYQDILKTIESNRHTENQSGPREGHALLAGLLRCGQCYSAMSVHYNGTGNSATYFCGSKEHTPCIRSNAETVDQALEAYLLEIISPMGMEAALRATQVLQERRQGHRAQIELELEAIRYDISHRQRQYDKVDSDNRLVASQLERSWNEALQQEQDCLAKLEEFDRDNQELTKEEEVNLRELGENLEGVWRSPQASWELKKQLLRAVIEEVLIKSGTSETSMRVIVHWKGGDHSELDVVRRNRNQTDHECVVIIRKLRGVVEDKEIAGILNRNGKRTARGLEWTSARVKRLGGQEGNVSLMAASEALEISEPKLRAMIKAGHVDAESACKWAPLMISREILQSPQTQETIEASRQTQMNLI